ncbi:MAG: YkvA family protein [Desulfobacterales bacterium]
MSKGIKQFWWRLLRNVPALLGLLKDLVFGGYRGLSWKSGALILFLLVYLFNPFDLVSDLVLGPGQIDDLVVLLGGMYLLEDELDRYRKWKDSRHGDHRTN